MATYTWLSDGNKLGVRDGSGVNGFDYEGSFVYKRDASGVSLDGVAFGGGRIVRDGAGSFSANYFLTDHLGSVRAVVDGGTGGVKERSDYYPFGSRHERGDYAVSDNRYRYNGKELQTTGNLGYLDYGARMYDADLGRWFGVDPLSEKYYGLSSYNYCANNPIVMVDPNGTYQTHYVDRDYNTILQTNDGCDDVVQVPDDQLALFKAFARIYSGAPDPGYFDDKRWNQVWKNEFGLAGRQFDDTELACLDMFNSKWSRNNAASFLLKPSLSNALKMGGSESLSQLTNLELVTLGLNVGVIGIQSVGDFIKSGERAFRYISKSELEAIQKTGRLRGGRAGATFFTKDIYKSATKAQNRLSLSEIPELRVEFEVLNNNLLLRNGTKILPVNGMTGKGAEFMTELPIDVRLINWQYLK